jgi:hypothetical protein
VYIRTVEELCKAVLERERRRKDDVMGCGIHTIKKASIESETVHCTSPTEGGTTKRRKNEGARRE